MDKDSKSLKKEDLNNQAHIYGAPPWQGEFPKGDQYDIDLLKNGDYRNVIDKYRYWSLEAIKNDLHKRRHLYHIAIENWQHDLNIGSIVRSANAFGAKSVHIIGNKRWNRRGAMVTDRYQNIFHHETIWQFYNWVDEMPVIAVDNIKGAVPLEVTKLPEECVFLFGQEGPGLSKDAISKAKMIVEITQYGSTRSINASAAAAIVMHNWILQNIFKRF